VLGHSATGGGELLARVRYLLELLRKPSSLRVFTFSIPCIVVQLLQFKPTNAHNFSKITVTLCNTSCYMLYETDASIKR